MAQETVFKCDVCGKQIGNPFGPLCLQATAPWITEKTEVADVCGIECAAVWLENLPEKFS